MIYYAAKDLCSQFDPTPQKDAKKYADIPTVRVLAIVGYENPDTPRDQAKSSGSIANWKIMNVKTKKIASNVFDWTFIHLPTFCAAVENEESEMSEKKKKGSEALYKPETLLDAWALFLSKKGEDRILDDDICR
ncbi:hypothetical protein ADUPG1_004984, partial [Aduncisulcus paluster]